MIPFVSFKFSECEQVSESKFSKSPWAGAGVTFLQQERESKRVTPITCARHRKKNANQKPICRTL